MPKLTYHKLPVPADLADELICIWTWQGDAVSTAAEADPIIPNNPPAIMIS